MSSKDVGLTQFAVASASPRCVSPKMIKRSHAPDKNCYNHESCDTGPLI